MSAVWVRAPHAQPIHAHTIPAAPDLPEPGHLFRCDCGDVRKVWASAEGGMKITAYPNGCEVGMDAGERYIVAHIPATIWERWRYRDHAPRHLLRRPAPVLVLGDGSLEQLPAITRETVDA